MRRVRVTLPATITEFGCAAEGLSLALALHVNLEVIERKGDGFVVETMGEGAGVYSLGLRHPSALGMMRVFQLLERTVFGLTLRIDNAIPLAAGLGAEAAFSAAGMIAANNLLGNPLSRADLIEMAAQTTRQASRVAAGMLGGLVTGFLEDIELIYRNLPIERMSILLVVLESEELAAPPLERVPREDALHDLTMLPLLLEGLRTGNYDLIGRGCEDRLSGVGRRAVVPSVERFTKLVNDYGGVWTTSGIGAALIVFAPDEHRKLAADIEALFRIASVKARTWILPVDTQGVVVSAAQSA
jgi:homoserine kinase